MRHDRRSLRRRLLQGLAATPLTLTIAGARIALANEKLATPDGGPYVPTPWPIVDEMLKLAEIAPEDTVVDLGSGDGRLVIAAAKRHGARGFGIEIDGKLAELARREARGAGVADRVEFIHGDIFDHHLGRATAVTLYLLPRLMPRLVPKLRAELPPGARVVSHDYPLDPWPSDKQLKFHVDEKLEITGMTETTLFFYVVPARIGGEWTLELPAPLATGPLTVAIDQTIDRIGGGVTGSIPAPLRDLTVRGTAIRFGLLIGGRLVDLRGKIDGDTMTGEVRARDVAGAWSARRIR